MNDRRFPVSILAGISIATIGLELPALAAPQPAPILVAQQRACVVSKKTAVYTTANPGDPQVQGRILVVGTPVAFVAPLPPNPPARVEINQPISGFVDFAALDCGKVTPPLSQKTTACRKVRNTVSPMNVYREPSWQSKPIGQIQVFADQTVYVTQTGGVTTSSTDKSGEGWVEVDLQRTFGKNFGLSPSVGWLSNTDPDNQMSTLVNGCGR